jgi:hypothetical protein
MDLTSPDGLLIGGRGDPARCRCAIVFRSGFAADLPVFGGPIEEEMADREVEPSAGATVWTAVFAVVALLIDAMAVPMMLRLEREGAPHAERGWLAVLAVGIVALGLVCQRKWAAVLFAGGAAASGAWLAIGGVFYVPLPFAIINILFGAALWLPLFVTLRYWKALQWRGRLWI